MSETKKNLKLNKNSVKTIKIQSDIKAGTGKLSRVVTQVCIRA